MATSTFTDGELMNGTTTVTLFMIRIICQKTTHLGTPC
jgi:hypothetical protein